MVTLQTAALPEKMTPLVAQEFTFPNLSSPLSGLPSDDFSMALTPSSSQIFTVPSIPASPLLVSSSTSAPLVVTTMTSTMTTATATGAHPPSPSPPPPPPGSKNEQESLFPEQATLSEKLTFMKYIEENPDSPTTFVELMQQIGPGSRYAVAKRAPSRPRLGLVHRSDSFSADVQSKLKQHLKRRKSEADVVASKATPPLLFELIGHQTAPKRVKVDGNEKPGPPPSLIPVDVVESKEDGRSQVQMSSLDHRLSVSSVSSTEDRRKEMKRFPSSGTLSEKLAYLKWRESCANDDDDDDDDDEDGGDVESSLSAAATTTVTSAVAASTKTAVASELIRGETKCKVDIQRGRLPNTFHFTWSQSVNHK